MITTSGKRKKKEKKGQTSSHPTSIRTLLPSLFLSTSSYFPDGPEGERGKETGRQERVSQKKGVLLSSSPSLPAERGGGGERREDGTRP